MADEIQQHQAEQVQTMARIREIDRTMEQLTAERKRLESREAELGGIVATIQHMQRPHVSESSIEDEE